MPDRDLPKHLRNQLSASLETGAPLAAPLPAQARFATARATLPPARWRLRALTVAVAATGIVAVAFAGPPQPREWVSQSVNSLEKQVGVPAGDVSPSPAHASETNRGQSATHQSPEQEKQPEQRQSPEPSGTSEPHESPEPDQSTGGDHPQPSPTATASPADH